jgi:hypothetical protein
LTFKLFNNPKERADDHRVELEARVDAFYGNFFSLRFPSFDHVALATGIVPRIPDFGPAFAMSPMRGRLSTTRAR